MSRLVTQLVADDPAIVLVGENTILFEKLSSVLSQKSVVVHKLTSQKIRSSIESLQAAYKIVWVFDGDYSDTDNYLAVLTVLKEVQVPIVVVVPVFQSISDHNSDLFLDWHTKSKAQLQFIVDCNYHLAKASFIFGQDVVGNNDDKSVVSFICSSVSKGLLLDPGNSFSFFSVDDFISQISELVFIPKKQQSVLIKGKSTNNTQFISLLKKLYDAYHSTNIEVLHDNVTFSEIIPFTVKETVVSVDIRTIATFTVKNLPVINKNKESKSTQVIPTPNETKEPTPQPEVRKIYQPENFSPSSQDPDKQEEKANISSESLQEASSEENKTQVSSTETLKETTPQQNKNSQQNTSSQQETVDVNKEIQRIFKDSRTEKKVERVTKIADKTTTIKKKSKRKTGLFYGGLVSIGMALAMILAATVYFFSGKILQEQLVSALEATAESETFLTEPSLVLQKNANFVASQTAIYGQIIEVESIVKNSVLVNLSQQLFEIPDALFEADKASKNLVIQVLSGNIGETAELTEILTQKAQQAYEKLSLMQASLEQADLDTDSEKQNKLLFSLENKVKEIRSGLAIQQQLQPILPDLLGTDQKKTYALLLQNNQEIRPTGGFIQAVALLNFDEGSLVSYKVYSIYELDKSLPGKVVPPEEITKYLGEESWYMRDSNWNPHFPEASKQIAWFIEKSLGAEVDGVIAMNVHSLVEVIKGTGSIDLPEYNEVITHKNLEERMEFHSEVVLVDSPESVDYAVKILRETLAHLITLKEDSVPTLLSGINTSFETKQLQIASFDESAQSIFNTLGWSGALVVPSCPARLSVVDCSVDVMAQVEANIGVNKANYYLKRSIVHDVFVSPTQAKHKRIVTFENTAKSNSWPKGTYKSYQRFFIDSEAVVDSVLINGSPLVAEQISQTKVGEFTSVGIRVDVPIQKQVTVELVYSTPLTNSADGFSYVFYNRKQSGLEDDPFTVVISHSQDIKPTLVAPSANISGNVITFTSDSLDDAALFGVKFE